MIVGIEKGKAGGRVSAPPSKSAAHRMLICAALAEGKSTVENLPLGEDVKATSDCLGALGAGIEINGNTASVVGTGGKFSDGKEPLCCRESGSTLRFLIPLSLTDGKTRRFTGSARLFARPLEVYKRLCDENGFLFRLQDGGLETAGRLSAGRYEVEGNISSQFITGLLTALPLCKGESLVAVKPPYESRTYISMTIEILKTAGIYVADEGLRYRIPALSKYRAAEYKVPGDCSNAAYFEALNSFGGSVEVEGLSDGIPQADRVYKQLFERLKNETSPSIDISDCPDLAPVLMAVSAGMSGCTLTSAARLRLKESDRGAVMAEELRKFGAECEITEDTVKVGVISHAPVLPLCGHNDHRIVMALSVLLTLTGGLIEGAEAVNKSFPDFFDKLAKTGIEVKTV